MNQSCRREPKVLEDIREEGRCRRRSWRQWFNWQGGHGQADDDPIRDPSNLESVPVGISHVGTKRLGYPFHAFLGSLCSEALGVSSTSRMWNGKDKERTGSSSGTDA